MKTKNFIILAALFSFGTVGLARHIAMADSSISFQIHNNQDDVASLSVYDTSDKNNPHLVTTLSLKSGSTSSPIQVSTIPGASSGRANWRWDGNETNGINVQDGGIYELSSGASRNN